MVIDYFNMIIPDNIGGFMFVPIFADIKLVMLHDLVVEVFANVVVAREIFSFCKNITCP